MKKHKTLKICLIVIGAILLIFVGVVGVNVYQDLQIEDALDREIWEIDYILNTSDLNDNRIDRKLNSFVARDEYLVVERAIKDYLKDILDECRHLESVYNNYELNEVLYLYNFDADAPYFYNSKNIITSAKEDLVEIKDNLNNLLKEETIMAYINNKRLDSYYIDYYKELMIGQDMLEASSDDIDENINYGISMLDAYMNYFNFLSDNADYWTSDEYYIYFETDELTDEYNRLLDIINNMDFTTDIESYI